MTWGSHSHFVSVRYTTREFIRRNIVYYGSPLHFSCYNNSPPYLCFPFLGKWYTYNRSCIKCDFYLFTIATGIINIRAFNAAIEMYSLVFIGVRPLYIFPPIFLTLNSSFYILGTLVGSKSFVELFVAKVFHEDLGMIFNLPMFTNL